LLTTLARHQIPLHAEQKYFNTIAFYDHIHASPNLGRFTGAAQPSAAPSGAVNAGGSPDTEGDNS
jgi:hypothetical protein